MGLRMNLAAVLLALISFVSSHPLPKRASFLPVPHDDPFYNAPENLESLKAGEVFNKRTIDPEVEYALAHEVVQLAFRTSDTFNNASHTVATVFSPSNPDPDAKLFSIQVAEDAANIDCSISYSFYGGLLVPDGAVVIADVAIMINWALSKGYYVVATDHEGPKSTFFAGFNEGHAGIDGIRAAISHLGVTTNTPVGLYGYSGGAHATVWMADLIGSYAPELNIIGAAHGGTPVDAKSTMKYLDGGQQGGMVVGALSGLLKAYPEQANTIWPKLSAKLQNDISTMYSDNTCIISELLLFAYQEVHEMISEPDFYTFPPIADILHAESLLSNVSSHAVSTPKFPRYMFHSKEDDVIVFSSAKEYVAQQCANGADIQFVEWPAGNHVSLEVLGLPNAIQFLQQAFEGKTPNVTCGTAANDILTITTVGVGSIIGQAIVDAMTALNGVVTPLGKIILNL